MHGYHGGKRNIVLDEICGMGIEASAAFVRLYNGVMHYFCCPECKKTFEAIVIKHESHDRVFDSGSQCTLNK